MPLKYLNCSKVQARLVPHPYAMARSRLLGATMIIAWSMICNNYYNSWHVSSMVSSYNLDVRKFRQKNWKKISKSRCCFVFVRMEFTPSIVVFCNFCQVAIPQVVGGRGRLFVCCVFVVFVFVKFLFNIFKKFSRHMIDKHLKLLLYF